MRNLMYAIAIVLISVFYACETSNPKPDEVSSFTNGVFIVNEGFFGANNGSLSFYSKDSLKMTNNIFRSLTGNQIGDVFQSMTIIGNKAYLVANASQKIEVLNLENHSNSRLTDLSYPRYVAKVNDQKAYISNGNGFGQDYIFVLDTENDIITDSIAIATGPETFLKEGNSMFVACKGGFLVDSTVYVIDTEKDEITDTIQVGQVPVEMVRDAWGKIWVLCNGRNVWDAGWTTILESIPGVLVRFDPISMQVDKRVFFNGPIAGFSTNNLAINNEGNTLYINNGNIEAYHIESDEKSVLINGANWYGIDVDPDNGDIWGTMGSGKVQVYNKAGNKLAEHTAGVSPSAAIFVGN